VILPGNIFTKTRLIPTDFKSAGVLVFLNILVYLLICLPDDWAQSNDKTLDGLDQPAVRESLHQMYLQTKDPIDVVPKSKTFFFKDFVFWNQIEKFPFKGDVVQIEKNKNLMGRLKDYYQSSAQYKFGLSEDPTTPWVWLTYQFMHAGLFHLLSNMLFLYLTCQILQRFVSTEWILATYILGGIGAGVGFLAFDFGGQVAMVGASGAICALMSFLTVVKNIENIEWSFFFAFTRKGFGVIHMPAFLLFPMYLMTDFTYLLLQSSSSTVAYSAHVGGSLAGLFLGLFFVMDQKVRHHILKEWGSTLNQKEIDTLRQKDVA